jgi:signal transduction histidine kinase
VTFRRIPGMTVDASPSRPLPGRAGVVAATAVFAAIAAIGVGLGRIQRDQLPLPVTAAAAVVATAAAALLVTGVPVPSAGYLPARYRPLAALLGCAALATAGIAVISGNRSANPVCFTICLLAGWCALVGGRGAGLVYWAPVTAWFAAEWIWVDPDPGWGAWIAGTTFTLCGGLLIRQQLGLVAQLRAAQAGLAAKARAEERNRISRDLHDVIAHTLTVSLLHVMSARLAVEHDPEDAARALAEAERLGRESLDEVRQVVGMLRDDSDISQRTSPLPGASGLPELAERFRAAGADIAFASDGDTSRLPATTGLAMYRILQEALTNVIKHGGGAPATARLVISADTAILTVDSLGAPGPVAADGAGHGLLSMCERAESLGGTCEAGPSGAGWLVRARFPLARLEARS